MVFAVEGDRLFQFVFVFVWGSVEVLVSLVEVAFSHGLGFYHLTGQSLFDEIDSWKDLLQFLLLFFGVFKEFLDLKKLGLHFLSFFLIHPKGYLSFAFHQPATLDI